MSVYIRIRRNVEDAFASALLTEAAGTLSGNAISGGTLDGFNIYKGHGLEDFAPPAVTVVCDRSGPHDAPAAAYTGNKDCTLTVTVYGHMGDSTRDGHASAVAQVEDLMSASNLVALLNDEGVADFTAVYARPMSEQESTKNGMMATALVLRVICRPS